MADETDFQLQNSFQAIEYGRETVKMAATLNGGACVALIGFLKADTLMGSGAQVRDALLWLCLGLIFAFLASAMGYIAQTHFAKFNQDIRRYNARPVGKAPTNILALANSTIGILFVFGSVLSFVGGVWIAGDAIFSDKPSAARWSTPAAYVSSTSLNNSGPSTISP